VLRAKGLGCKVKHIYNASIMNAVAGCGLQLYRFGQAVSICFFTRTWRPDSFYDRIKENADLGLHTLLLLDIRVKEPSVEALCRGKKEYEPPRFMSCATCARQMLEVEEARGEKVYGPDSMCVAVARMGQDDELIKTCTLKEMCNIDMGGPLHSMVLVGETHPLENDMLAMHRATENDFLPEDQVPSCGLFDYESIQKSTPRFVSLGPSAEALLRASLVALILPRRHGVGQAAHAALARLRARVDARGAAHGDARVRGWILGEVTQALDEPVRGAHALAREGGPVALALSPPTVLLSALLASEGPLQHQHPQAHRAGDHDGLHHDQKAGSLHPVRFL
jgi:hypothetical protein